VALGQVVDPKAKRHAPLRSGGLTVVVTEGGHSAWAFDQIVFGGRPLAVTAVLNNTNDLWTVSAAVVAEAPAGRQLKAEAARDAIVPPGATTVGTVAAAAAAVVERWKLGLLDQQRWGDDLSGRSDAIVAGPGAGDVARGKAAIKRLWQARMAANTRLATSGEPRAATTADGQLAWVSAPVTRVADGEGPLPLRVFAIYEKDGAAWRLVALHEAVAVDAPGSGTAWKKVLPPEPPKPEPAKAEPAKAEPAKAEPDTASAAKKKKAKNKKSKPARSADD